MERHVEGSPSAARLSSRQCDYARARELIASELGAEAIARLHAQNPVFDWAAVILLPSLFGGLAIALGRLPLGVPWLVGVVIQGFVIQGLAYAVHDLFVHRRVGGSRLGYALGVALDLPVFFRRTWYALYHVDHHAHMGTALDTEAYKQDLDRRWKRFLCLTVVGGVLARARRLKPSHAYSSDVGKQTLAIPTDPLLIRQLRVERVAVWLAALALVPAAVLWWRPVVLGYVVPLLVVTPVASLLRLILEHAETNPDNIFHCATFYRTGPITRPLFFWDAGDCHIVHHLYPGIPFYRMAGAVELMRPILLRQGARERRSLLTLLYGFFVRNEPHRALWHG